MYIQGLDLSHLNENVNLDHLGPGIRFVFLKASQGATFQDPMFQQYYHHMKAKGIIRGAYHFLSMNARDSAQQQADNFLSRGVDFSLAGVLPPVLDIENQVPANLDGYILANKAKCVQLITDWLRIVEDRTGRKPIIYSYRNFFSEYLDGASWPDNGLWLAAYQASPPQLPHGWNSYQFWQNSQFGTLSGNTTGGDVDMDLFNGTMDELNTLANAGS